MITIKTGNYTPQEKAIISDLCKIAIDQICTKCGNLCTRFSGYFPCPYKWLIYDIDLVDQKFSNLAVTENNKK